ncbi:DUF1624 domain-containing protein [Hoeflea sp. TYP-13]|uniref:DUF1624 domain-containing protein n=1 Tax=Hoeflea sp. TYP-13 TaxID=3230023 RepID=UPI0034C5B844
MTDLTHPIPAKQRVVLVDVARGLALLAMAIYHFAWDLEFFGYAPSGMTAFGGWKFFARSIAGSFLFLVGVSLVLGHGRAIRWRPFAIRLAMIVAAAAAITALTFYAMPDRYIFFGILHCIAVSSVLGLVFLRLPVVLTALTAAVILFAGPYIASPFFNQGALLWLGLSTQQILSNDFVPIFPWFGAVLLGIGAAKAGQQMGLFAWLASIYRGENRAGRPLAFAGRHSLAFYLLHQPVLISLVYLASLVFPAPAADPIASNIRSCNHTCVQNNPAEFCSRFCDCTINELVRADLIDAARKSQSSGEQDAGINEIVNTCTASAFEETRAE